MVNERVPKVGEVWTGKISGHKYTCIVDIPDKNGDYIWKAVGRYVMDGVSKGLMIPPVDRSQDFTSFKNCYYYDSNKDITYFGAVHDSLEAAQYTANTTNYFIGTIEYGIRDGEFYAQAVK